MSQETSSWAKEQRCGDPVTKAVLMEIANWAKPTGVCEFLSVKRIAEVVEVSTRTVQRHLDRLESMDLVEGGLGMLRRIERHRDDGGRGANCFELIGYEPPLSLGARPLRQSVTPPRHIVTSPRQNDGEPHDTGVTRLGDKIESPSPSNEGEPPIDENDDGKGESGQGGDAEPAVPAVVEVGVKAHRLPDSWEAPSVVDLPPKARELVRQWPPGAYEAVCEMFRLHWHSEERSMGRKRNWLAALGKWIISDHAKVMRDAKFGVSFAALAPAPAAGTVPQAEPVPERAMEGGTADKLRAALRKAVGGKLYDCWFAPAALLIRGESLHVVTPNAFSGSYIDGNFSMQLLAAANATGAAVRVIKTETSGRKASLQ